MRTSSTDSGRRQFLSRIVLAIQGAIGGTVAFVFGGAIMPSGFGRRPEQWLPVATLGELPHNEPTSRSFRIVRDDGYTQLVDRQVVFLVKTGDTEVTALSSTCTHLGCRVSWDSEAQVLRCPCHGGTYDRTGAVVAGPPPGPLATLRTRVEGDRILVQV